MIECTYVAYAQHAGGMHECVNVDQRKRRFRYRSTIGEIQRNRLKLIVRDRRCGDVQPNHAPAFG